MTRGAGDPESDAIAWKVTGPDADQFSTQPRDADDGSQDGAMADLSFVTPPDFENPADADVDNTYQFAIEITDRKDAYDRSQNAITTDATQDVTVTVTDVADQAPPANVTLTPVDDGDAVKMEIFRGPPASGTDSSDQYEAWRRVAGTSGNGTSTLTGKSANTVSFDAGSDPVWEDRVRTVADMDTPGAPDYGPYSDWVRGRAHAAPVAVGLTVSSGQTGEMVVTWHAADFPKEAGSTIESYDLEWTAAGAGWDTSLGSHTVTDTTQTPNTITGLIDSTTYEVRMRARTGNGPGLWSPPSARRREPPALGAPAHPVDQPHLHQPAVGLAGAGQRRRCHRLRHVRYRLAGQTPEAQWTDLDDTTASTALVPDTLQSGRIAFGIGYIEAPGPQGKLTTKTFTAGGEQFELDCRYQGAISTTTNWSISFCFVEDRNPNLLAGTTLHVDFYLTEEGGSQLERHELNQSRGEKHRDLG